MTPGTLDFKDIIRKDTFEELTIALKIDGAPIDLTGADICMQSKLKPNFRPAHTWDIQVPDPSGGILKISQWEVDLEAGTYEHDLKIRLSNGLSLTYLKGKMKVIQNVSECQ